MPARGQERERRRKRFLTEEEFRRLGRVIGVEPASKFLDDQHIEA